MTKDTNIEGLTHNQFLEMLRDQIAISAMEGLLAAKSFCNRDEDVELAIAALAYKLANAMLTERLKHLNKEAV